MDNYYATCPPKMSDGRHITDYTESTLKDEQIKHINGIIRDDEYRLFLQQNGATILDREWDYMKSNNSCWLNECVHTYPTSMYPGWFTEENSRYNALAEPNRDQRYECKKQVDYRCGSVARNPKTKVLKPATTKTTISVVPIPQTK